MSIRRCVIDMKNDSCAKERDGLQKGWVRGSSVDAKDEQVLGQMIYCIGRLYDDFASMELTVSDSRRKLEIPRPRGRRL